MEETESSAITEDEDEYDGEEDDSQESSFTDYNPTSDHKNPQ